MNFDTWFGKLQARTAQNPGAGLAAFGRLLDRLHHPQTNYKIIHVAGTNGKGTVCTLLARVLTCAGEKTGLFISPHLILPTERIQLNDAEIAPADFVAAVKKVQAQEKEPLNFFELITAAALVYFAEKKAAYVVLETGLGGRKDPTNVCTPILSIITSIGLDHTQILGDTLEKIAVEKTGIIKPGVPVLCGELPPAAAHVVAETAREKQAPLAFIGAKKSPGSAQAQNVQLVRCAAKFLGIADRVVDRALETVQIPGRFEVFHRGNKTIILDGAHNPPAVENLLAFWQTTPYSTARAAVLCAFMQDKDYPQMLRLLGEQFKMGVVTALDSPRSLKISLYPAYQPCGMTREIFPPGWEFIPGVPAALAHAQELADVVLVTGSFYLVGAVRAQLVKM